MQDRVNCAGLQVEKVLFDFIKSKALPGTGVASAHFWDGFSALVHEFGPKNRALLAKREDLQKQIDDWHIARRGKPHDAAAYEAFLREIGYLVPEGPDFSVETRNVDPEIATIPGPQLVVPIMNARFALNAANARWGSLYDALYGTDALGDLPTGKGYDAERGARVIAWGRDHLDLAIPLEGASWRDLTGISADADGLSLTDRKGAMRLAAPAQYAGYRVNQDGVPEILFQTNHLLVELVVDPTSVIGQQDGAGISDVWLESAVSAIMDCEDSVAAVDAADKTLAYANWLGLMKGDLVEQVSKAGRSFTRALNPDYVFTGADGAEMNVKGRALMLVRNVGHLMSNPAILDRDGNEVGEGLMDAMCTVLCAMHDLTKTGGVRNSTCQSVYVVKPKMHGPEEVAFADEIFTAVEKVLGLAQNTVKLGIMDEERRTSANLKECIRAAKHRVAFINTGFLDRTGDEIHTSMEAGAMVRKGEMKTQPWISAYEDRNVDIGLACGLSGKAQIGKGMWAMPDLMQDMLVQKIGHPQAGANCAWVPSPTAATLHATHYHKVDVFERQREIAAKGARGKFADLMTIPVAPGRNWSADEITAELENNAQGILGYVVRWVDQGVGCSKVPDIHNVALMEDRATCRISSQHMANWLHHGIVDQEGVMAVMQRMAVVVDEQNANDPAYSAMAPKFDGAAFQAAVDLVLKGAVQPSGYTEPILHARRLELKVNS